MDYDKLITTPPGFYDDEPCDICDDEFCTFEQDRADTKGDDLLTDLQAEGLL